MSEKNECDKIHVLSAGEKGKGMNTKGSKHMTLQQRIQIETNLKVNSTCKHIAKEIGMDERTVSREIRLRRDCEKNGKYGTFNKYDDTPCKKIEKFPFVCNGCSARYSCFRQYKYYYHATVAQENYEIILVDSRVGLDMDLEEKEILDTTIRDGVSKGQSLYHIVTTNPEKIHCSVSTAYRIINDKKTITQRLDLRRSVKLKPRNHYAYKEDNHAIREGRKYQDFLVEYNKHPFSILVEMDTVEGPKDQDECLLTLHIVNTHFMFAKILKRQDKECVTQAFMELRSELGLELYKKLFRFILTDRGTEFCNPAAIETDFDTGERIANVYFCNSYASYQKGSIEENHELLRYVIPKKTYFGHLTQDQINLMLSHINSYARKSLESTPYELTRLLIGDEFLEKEKIRPINPDLVNVTGKLLK